jgi:IstB-like ATP binding protein
MTSSGEQMHVCNIDGCPFADAHPGQLVRHRREVHPDRLCSDCKKDPRSPAEIYCQGCIDLHAEHECRERERQWTSIAGDWRSRRRRMQGWSFKTFPADDAAGASALDAVEPWLWLVLSFRLIDRELREIDPRHPDPDIADENHPIWDAYYTEDYGRNLYIYGGVGSGKTGLAWSLLRARVLDARYDWEDGEAQYPAFANVVELLDEAKAAMRDGGAPIRNLYESSLLVLDDLGAERPTDWTRDAIHALVQHRHTRDLPTVVTSNYAPSALARRLGHDDPLIGKRIVSRLTENCTKVKLDRPDLRLQRTS